MLYVSWLVTTTPCVILGGFISIKTKDIEIPFTSNRVPGIVPNQPFLLNKWVHLLLAGLILFGYFYHLFSAVAIEFNYIMNSIWRSYFYYLFGVLLIVKLTTLVISVEISIISVYIILCRYILTKLLERITTGGGGVI